tara:strand:+ start:868 stop:1521 length:654 start_codon:yes stop_codon:yes gene_type:complete
LDYLSTLYSRKDKPKTKYPSILAKYLFKKYIKDSNKSFLETGCGRGDLLEEFRKLNLNVIGTDLLESAGKDYPLLTVFQNNIEKDALPFRTESIDIIFSKSFVEHLYNPKLFFDEAYRVLKKEGMLITLTPDWEVQTKKFYDDWTHKTPFSKETMKNLYKVSNFKELEISYFKQLPWLWENKFLFFLSNIVSPFIREREKTNLRWVRERQILGIGIK